MWLHIAPQVHAAVGVDVRQQPAAPLPKLPRRIFPPNFARHVGSNVPLLMLYPNVLMFNRAALRKVNAAALCLI
jgi:hypothetical protein